MNKLFKGWNFLRIMRLVLGLFITVQGIMDSQWLFAMFGALFSLMPILNVGCCASSNCTVNTTDSHKAQKGIGQVVFEEVRNK